MPNGNGTQPVVKTATKVVNSMKRVREEIVRFQYAAATYNILSGTEVEMYTFGGTPGDRHEVRIGECEELVSIGYDPAFNTANPTNYYMDHLRVYDRDDSEWVNFLTFPNYTRMNGNQLPFNNALNFERQMMSWGFKSFLSSLEAIASTLKLPEGDQLNIGIQAAATGNNVVLGNNRATAIMRRYLPGSDVDYRHFNEYNGGLKSNNKYYNEVQLLAASVANQWTQSWRLQIIRNEAYKIFTGGVLPNVALATAAQVSHLVEAKILIDDPLWEYNKYFVNHHYNNMPFVDSNAVYGDGNVATPWVWKLEKKNRFTPTIDILKNRNRDLTVYVRDDGTPDTNIYTAMTGVKFQI